MNILVLICIALFPLVSYASVTEEECLGCHDKYKESKHGQTTCVRCHDDIGSLPHYEKLKRPSCNACHSKIATEHRRSIHSEKNLSCKNCHDVHFPAGEKKGCLSCHAGVSHASLPSSEKHLKAIDCLVCHGKSEKGEIRISIDTGKKDPIKREIIDPDGNRFLDHNEWNNLQALLQKVPKGKEKIKKQFLAKTEPHSVTKKPVTCKSCHSAGGIFQQARVTIIGKQPYSLHTDPRIFIPELPSIEDYKHTVHGKKGIECFDCHTSQKRIDDSTCMACHDELYGIYKYTAHSEKGATQCTDCHNPHHIKAYKELSAPERLTVCVRCHKDYINKHKWLPNTVLHFHYLECSTCHSPDSTKSMVFGFAVKEGEKETPLKYHDFEEIFGRNIELEKLIDRNGDGTIFCKELAGFFIELRRRLQKEVVINSSIVVTKAYHNYSEKNTKSKVCADCHSEKAPFYESMFLSIPTREKIIHIPVKGSVLSALPTSVFIDMSLLGEGKIRARDFNSILKARRGDMTQLIDELGFKLIDLVGIVFSVLILSGIAIHILLRIVMKK